MPAPEAPAPPGPVPAGPVRVRVPATSANLGPAFDAAGLALGRYDEITAEILPGTAPDILPEVIVTGEGSDDLRRDARHLVVRAVLAAYDDLGVAPAGALRVRCHNRIPHGRGLGSSAAAVTAGVVLGRLLAGCPPDVARGPDALAVAAALEGHPDNAAACLLGGFTLAWTPEDGRPLAVRLDPHPELWVLVALPRRRLSTRRARGLLPDVVSHADAVGGAARAALLTAALTTRPDLLLEATEDRLHQEYRRPAMPDTLDLVDRLRAAGHAATVSGAGPAVLVLGTGASAEVRDLVAAAGRSAQVRWQLLAPPVDTTGTVVVDSGRPATAGAPATGAGRDG